VLLSIVFHWPALKNKNLSIKILMQRPDVSFQTAAQRVSQGMRESRALKKSVCVIYL